MTGRYYYGDEDAADQFEARETRLRLGAHHDEGAGPGEATRRYPIWAYSSAEQDPCCPFHTASCGDLDMCCSLCSTPREYDLTGLREGFYEDDE